MDYFLDPAKNPAAGDLFTAEELSISLMKNFQIISQVKFLHKGVDWYSLHALQDIDILITLLDDYDISKALGVVESSTDQLSKKLNGGQGLLEVKPGLITVAWIRNWFQRWLQHPWLGNYDLLLVSSDLANK